VLLVGFVVRIYHDARSSECEIKKRKATVMLLLNADVSKTKTLWENGVRGTATAISFNYIISSYESLVEKGTESPLFNAYAKKRGHN